MIIQNSTDIKTELFYDKNGDISPIDIKYEKQIINPNGLVQLQKIPTIHSVFDITSKSGANVIKYNKVDVILNETDFTVDYENGILTFHSSQKGKEVQISYTNAIGRLSISADRVFTEIDSQGGVINTLQNILDDGRDVLSGLNVLGGAKKVVEQTQANIDSIKGLTGSIVEGNNIKTSLDNSNTTARNTDTALKSSITNANNKIQEMTQWVDQNGNIVNLNNRVTTAEGKLNTVNTQLDLSKKNIQINNPKDDNKYGIELLNFSGQGRPYPENGSSKGIVVHNYTDSEAVVIDNVGEAPTIRVAGARNSTRRADKPQDYCARPNHLQIVQAFMNEDNTTHKNLTLWNLDWAGNIWYRSTMPTETKAPSIMTATQELADSGFFAMTIGSFYETRLILNLLYKNGGSALKFFLDGAKNTIMQSSDGGIKSIAYKLDNTIESTEGNVILKALNGEAFINTDGVNKIVGRFVQTPPTSKTSSGKRGDFSADVNYFYVCYATNAWHRIAKDSTW